MPLFNPIDYPIIFTTPVRLTRHSFWQEHIPFGMGLVQMLKPRLLVELGTHYGDSYCAFCQAVKESELPTRCYAVDNWQGDEHIPAYSSDVLRELREHHDPLYGNFSTLVQSDFLAALESFSDGTIDLLHLDGTHTYEAVKNDFYSWLPKMSQRGVILFHDTNVLDRHYGVRLFFDEIKQSYPHFEFLHGYGLGVLAVGTEQPEAFRALLETEGDDITTIRRIFYALGHRLTLLRNKAENQSEIQRLNSYLAGETATWNHKLNILESEKEHAIRERDQVVSEQQQFIHLQQQTINQLEQATQALKTQLAQITNSKGWALLQKFWNLRSALQPSAGLPKQAKPAGPVAPPIAPVESSPAPPKAPPLIAEPPAQIQEPHSLLLPEPVLPPNLLESLNRANHIELGKLAAPDLRAIAFYLPQFHPIPENDQWWGKGFTEWANVSKAQPNFVGHYQPHLPADLGFYDLRVPETREHQAELAKAYGIHGFCYYHYWFGGRRLLERPFNEALKSGRPDFPFCICWANENWTRRWDGLEQEILIGQNHSEEDDRNFIRDLFPAFEDHRYIRVNGQPLLLVYRADILPAAARTVERWREETRKAGLGEIYLVAAQTFGFTDPREFGFDAAVEFPPHKPDGELLTGRITRLNQDFDGVVLDYTSMMKAIAIQPPTDYKRFRTVIPCWDNTPRRQNGGRVYLHSTPAAYEYWLGQAVRATVAELAGDERMVFINAWNEWGEGAHLEPDRQFGHQYL
ncbi:MAG: glycoside hydrolase family 99-like domain-containing protein, partial [Blastocatellia bacterium]